MIFLHVESFKAKICISLGVFSLCMKDPQTPIFLHSKFPIFIIARFSQLFRPNRLNFKQSKRISMKENIKNIDIKLLQFQELTIFYYRA